MNTIEFLEKLSIVFTLEGEESNSKKKICMYANMLDNKLKEKKRKPDFERTFNFILENYPYKNFPMFHYILNNLKYEIIDEAEKERIKFRGFKVETDIGIYDFWGYLPKEENVELISKFKVVDEITNSDKEDDSK